MSDISGKSISTGEADIRIEPERMVILPRLGEVLYLSFVDIIEMAAKDYRLEFQLSSSEKLSIYDLGHKFDDLAASLARARNAMIMKYLLMNESIRKSTVPGYLQLIKANGESESIANCDLSIYDTSIVFNSSNAEPIRIRYNQILASGAEDYALSIRTQTGDNLRFSQMGREFESTVGEFSRAMNDLDIQSQALVKDMVPLANPSTVREAARLLKDGMAAKRTNLDAIAPEIWQGFEKKFSATSARDSYQFLKSVARQDKMAGGIKRGLMGNVTGNYIWVLVPIYGSGSTGNAIALEAASISDTDRTGDQNDDSNIVGVAGATYFFRLVGRQEYSKVSLNDLDNKCDALISNLNGLMLDLNFRREPIYLSEKELADPINARYRYAVQKIPALKKMRELYIGRVFHLSADQWKRDVQDLLAFNVSSNDDLARWKAE